MSYYYKYKFVSPDPLFTRIKEEFRSYFDSNLVDDLLFPLWLDDAMKKMGKSSYKIVDTLLFVDHFEAKLPPDFDTVREAWMTATGLSPSVRIPGSYYSQITTVLNQPYDACNPTVNCDPCNPDLVTVVTKTNAEVSMPIKLHYLLTPGNISVRENCAMGCLNYHAHSEAIFDIRDNKMVTNFECGDVYLVYYSHQSDANGYQMIPDNYRVQEYIRAYLKQKVFETLYNQVTDETFNQVEKKYMLYKQQADEAYIMADIETKKKTIYEKAYAIYREEHRNDKYKLDYNRINGWGRGRHRTRPSNTWGF